MLSTVGLKSEVSELETTFIAMYTLVFLLVSFYLKTGGLQVKPKYIVSVITFIFQSCNRNYEIISACQGRRGRMDSEISIGR